tara:strand:- start:1667 stop:3142 length:1476 start_codon:yes stop_codon:yes gene_type:complete
MITGSKNSDILTIKEPAVVLEQIEVGNFKDERQTTPDKEKYMGNSTPHIKINGYEMDSNTIIKFKINSKDFLPTIDLAFIDVSKQFQNDFPKDGDLIELYIRSRNDNAKKKTRINFDILSIKGQSSKNKNIYTLTGIMKVPNLFSEKQLSFLEDTSYNHLLSVCDEIELGFASNETVTNDKMPRFNPNNTIKDFIKKTVDYSYKDENSFFTSYIDLYYYLTFVNVNTLFSMDETLEDGIADIISSVTEDKDSKSEGVKGDDNKIILSNHDNFNNTTNFIKSYSLFNNSGKIWITNGYKRYSQYMDMDTYEFQSFFVDPLTTEGSENDLVILKGKAGDESYKLQNKFLYQGRQFSTLNEGNLHPNYHYAKILNYQNNEELNKMGLTITLQDISSSISRYKRIPVAIYERNSGVIANVGMRYGDAERGTQPEQDGNTADAQEDFVANSFISGFYVVRDFSINWEKAKGFTQTVNLIRREWPIPYSAGVAKNKN